MFNTRHRQELHQKKDNNSETYVVFVYNCLTHNAPLTCPVIRLEGIGSHLLRSWQNTDPLVCLLPIIIFLVTPDSMLAAHTSPRAGLLFVSIYLPSYLHSWVNTVYSIMIPLNTLPCNRRYFVTCWESTLEIRSHFFCPIYVYHY